MDEWDSYPADYRSAEVAAISAGIEAGESVSVVGLSGAGKSNLLGFLARQPLVAGQRGRALVDGNRLTEASPAAFFRLMQRSLAQCWPAQASPGASDEPLEALDAALSAGLREPGQTGLCFLLDLSLLVNREGHLFGAADRMFFNNLRALRDAHKFRLSYVAATRHPLPAETELSELFYARTVWLGPLSEADARWNVARYAARAGRSWDEPTTSALISISGGYPSLLRAVCEAAAGGTEVELAALSRHPAVQSRLAEFWADQPSEAELQAARLDSVPLLNAGRPREFDLSQLTDKEHRLLQCLMAEPNQVVEKDALARAVWSEDRVYTRGVRDDSLAQLVRRLREKIEPDPAHPRIIQTVPGRGYRYISDATG